jgi:hypothetical protein
MRGTAAMPFLSAMLPRRAATPPAIPSLEAQVAGLDLLRCVSRRRLLHLEPGAEPCLAFMHLQAAAEVLRDALDLSPGSDLSRHLDEAIALRLLEALSDPATVIGAGPLAALGASVTATAKLSGGSGSAEVSAPLGASLNAEAPLLVELPARAVVAGALPRGLGATPVAALPLASAADPMAFAAVAAQARLAGWGVALCGLTANTLGWLRPHPIAADWFILHWSEALRGGAALAGLRQLDPARIILTGCDTDAALDWGRSLQIRVFGGRWSDNAATSLSASPAGAIA